MHPAGVVPGPLTTRRGMPPHAHRPYAMTVRHLVFVQCAAECDDPGTRDTFVCMAHGIYPMCVTEEPLQRTLLFRRVFGAG